MRALYTAATGMMAQELNVQVISNNIANMRTTGYKRQRAEFQDLLYDHVRRIGTQTSEQGNILPVGIDLGSGVKTVGTPRLMSQGNLAPTGNNLDVAIRGEGFFKIAMPDGTFAYTRDGSFQMDAQGRIVTAQGYVVPSAPRGILFVSSGSYTTMPRSHSRPRTAMRKMSSVRLIGISDIARISSVSFIHCSRETNGGGCQLVFTSDMLIHLVRLWPSRRSGFPHLAHSNLYDRQVGCQR